jgi:hypothetical protein
MDESTTTDVNAPTITAKFIGGDGSEGYKNGETYTLKQWEENDMVFISREDGSGQVAYESMDALINNWEMVEQPPEQMSPVQE